MMRMMKKRKGKLNVSMEDVRIDGFDPIFRKYNIIIEILYHRKRVDCSLTDKAGSRSCSPC